MTGDFAMPLLLRLGLYAAAVQLIVSVPMDVLRLGWTATQELPVIWQYPKVLFGVSVGTAALFVIDKVARRRLPLDHLGFILLVNIGVGIIMGLPKMIFGENLARYFFAHLGTGIMMFVCYAAYASLHFPAYEAWLQRYFRRLSKGVLWTMAIGFTVFAIRALAGAKVYWGLNAQGLATSFVWHTFSGAPLQAAASLVLVVLNGKRGVVLALLAVVVALIVRESLRRSAAAQLRAAVATGVLAFGALGAAGIVAFVDPNTPIIGVTAAKWSLLNPVQEGFDAERASAGRASEIVDSFKKWSSEPANYPLGAGYGWYFASTGLLSRDYADIRQHYIHFSPLNFVYQVGPVLTLIMFALIWRLLLLTFVRTIQRRGVDTALVLTLIVLANLVGGLTGYSYGTDPTIWAFLGLIAASKRAWLAQAIEPKAA